MSDEATDAAGEEGDAALDVTLAARVDEIPALHAQVEAFGEEHAVPFAVVNAINLALDEVLTNIATHGVREDGRGAGTIDVRVALVAAEGERGTPCLRVEVEDDSGAFDILAAKEPDTLAPVEERTVGGLGIFLVKRMMDRLAYERRGGRNLLVMEKNIPGAAG